MRSYKRGNLRRTRADESTRPCSKESLSDTARAHLLSVSCMRFYTIINVSFIEQSPYVTGRATHEMEEEHMEQETQELREPPVWKLRRLKSHCPVPDTAWKKEAYVADTDSSIATPPVAQDELAVGDPVVRSVDPISFKEAPAGRDDDL